jgi:hypothetical protein
VKTPAWVYAASLGVGLVGVFVPAFAPELVAPWEGSRFGFVAAAALAVVAHALLHLAVKPRLVPGALVALAALAVFHFVSASLGWSAFVANLAATGPDLWEEAAARRR